MNAKTIYTLIAGMIATILIGCCFLTIPTSVDVTLNYEEAKLNQHLTMEQRQRVVGD